MNKDKAIGIDNMSFKPLNKEKVMEVRDKGLSYW